MNKSHTDTHTAGNHPLRDTVIFFKYLDRFSLLSLGSINKQYINETILQNVWGVVFVNAVIAKNVSYIFKSIFVYVKPIFVFL